MEKRVFPQDFIEELRVEFPRDSTVLSAIDDVNVRFLEAILSSFESFRLAPEEVLKLLVDYEQDKLRANIRRILRLKALYRRLLAVKMVWAEEDQKQAAATG